MAALIDAAMARKLYRLWRDAGDLVGWVITTGTWDNQPDHILCVPHVVRRVIYEKFGDKEPQAQALYLHADSVEEMRTLLPPGLVRYPREPGDDPVIIETWM